MEVSVRPLTWGVPWGRAPGILTITVGVVWMFGVRGMGREGYVCMYTVVHWVHRRLPPLRLRCVTSIKPQ